MAGNRSSTRLLAATDAYEGRVEVYAFGLEVRHMRSVRAACILSLLSSAATAEECRILWWDIFLPQSAVELEKTSEVSAVLTMKNTGKLEPISFELALSDVSGMDRKQWSSLLGGKTIVVGGLSNEVTVALVPKTTSWLISFESRQTIRSQDGKTFAGTGVLGGYLVCEELKPWH